MQVVLHIRLGEVVTFKFTSRFLSFEYYLEMVRLLVAGVPSSSCLRVKMFTDSPSHREVKVLRHRLRVRFNITADLPLRPGPDDFHRFASAEVLVAGQSQFSRLAAALNRNMAIIPWNTPWHRYLAHFSDDFVPVRIVADWNGSAGQYMDQIRQMLWSKFGPRLRRCGGGA